MTIEEIKRRVDEAVICSDHDGRVNDVNAAFTTLFGWGREEILGQPLTAIIPPQLRDAHLLGFSRFLMTNTSPLFSRPMLLKAIDKGGRIFDTEHFIVAENRGGRWSFAASIRPAPNRPDQA